MSSLRADRAETGARPRAGARLAFRALATHPNPVLVGGTGRSGTIHVERNNPARSLYARLGFEVAEEKGVSDLLRARP